MGAFFVRSTRAGTGSIHERRRLADVLSLPQQLPPDFKLFRHHRSVPLVVSLPQYVGV